MSKNKKVVSIAIISILVCVMAITIALLFDRQKFLNSAQKAEEVINIANDSSGRVEKERYCMRNNLKYKQGKLFCFVVVSRISDSSKPDGSSQFSDITKKLGWSFNGNNLNALNDSNTTYVFANLYIDGKMNCYVREKRVSNTQLKLEAGCHGPAKAEWYPVRKD